MPPRIIKITCATDDVRAFALLILCAAVHDLKFVSSLAVKL